MTSLALPDCTQLRAHPELASLAALAVSLALTRDALAVTYPEDVDPLCPRLHALDVLLYQIDTLSDALAHYRETLSADESLTLT
jgi:hypothetical protein